jgi:hypothetical protein
MKVDSKEELGRCMTTFLFFNYKENRIAKMPKIFKNTIDKK